MVEEKNITIRFPLQIYDRVTKIADSMYRGSRTIVILNAVEDYLEEGSIVDRVEKLEREFFEMKSSTEQYVDLQSQLRDLYQEVKDLNASLATLEKLVDKILNQIVSVLTSK